MRTFSTGATRDSDESKIDFEGFLSPLVLKRYGEYMNRHRKQADGGIRASDNWQAGIPLDAYMKSLWRHFFDVWAKHRGHPGLTDETVEEELCAVLFNASGYLHEYLKAKDGFSFETVNGDFVFEIPEDSPLLHMFIREADSKEHAT